MSETKGVVVLIHGLWMTPKSWDGWKARFEAAGYSVVVPAWPGVTDDVIAMRRDPSALNGLRISTVADHLAGIIESLDETPIIMGHSYGGLMTQLMLDRGLGRAGVAINSAQSAGIPAIPWSVIRGLMPVFGKPWTVNRTVLLSPKQFRYAFTNSLTQEETDRVHEEFVIPAPGKPLWQAATHMFMNGGESSIDYAKPDRPPLIFVTGGADHVVPASVNHRNAKRYTSGVVDVKDFPGRTHYTVGQDGWEDVADVALSWAESH